MEKLVFEDTTGCQQEMQNATSEDTTNSATVQDVVSEGKCIPHKQQVIYEDGKGQEVILADSTIQGNKDVENINDGKYAEEDSKENDWPLGCSEYCIDGM